MKKTKLIKLSMEPTIGNIAKTFADHIYLCFHENHDKEEESHRPEIQVKFHDSSSIYFKILENSEVIFRTT